MSNLFYPVSVISKLDVTKADGVIADPFESGVTTTRSYWSNQNFKRKYKVQHAPLTVNESRFLRSFHSARQGQFDSFWFRDNLNRDGNASVRFSSPIAPSVSGGARSLTVDLDEVAAVRALPDMDDINTAAGSAPVLWYDANRELYALNAGTIIREPCTWDSGMNYRAAWQAGQLNIVPTTQYQAYQFEGVSWAKTAVNISQFAATQPACTIFVIANHSASASNQVLFAIGAKAAGAALGIQLKGSAFYTPYLGGTEAYLSAEWPNDWDLWNSLAVSWVAASNSVSFYANGALQGTESVTRTFTLGPASLGASLDGSSICNPGGTMANNQVAHVLLFAATLTLAQIKAVHNLLGYQFGLAAV